MRLSKHELKNAGIFQRGTYLAQITETTEYVDECEPDKIYWLFHLQIIVDNGFLKPHVHCVECSDDEDSEFAHIMSDLHQIMGKTPDKKICAQEVQDLYVEIVLDHNLVPSNSFKNEAILRNTIVSMESGRGCRLKFMLSETDEDD